MAEMAFALASILLAVAGFFWWDGTSWGALIAWFLAMWGAMFGAWGLVALRPPRRLACGAGVVLGAASAIGGAVWVAGGWWPWGIGCLVGGALAAAVGVWRGRRVGLMSPEERAELEASLDRGLEQASRGEGSPAEDVLRRLRSL